MHAGKFIVKLSGRKPPTRRSRNVLLALLAFVFCISATVSSAEMEETYERAREADKITTAQGGKTASLKFQTVTLDKAGNVSINEGDFHLVRGKKVPLSRDARRLAVRLKGDTLAKIVAANKDGADANAALRSVTQNTAGAFAMSIDKTLEHFKLVVIAVTPADNNATLSRAQINQICASDDFEFAAPVYTEKPSGLMLLTTDELLVRFPPELSESAIAAFGSRNNLTVVATPRNDMNVYVFRVADVKDAPVLAKANALNAEKEVVWAEPNFITEIEYETNDTYYGDQWHLNNTGQGGGVSDADVDAAEAWAVNTGASSVTVAIVDDGVELAHEDLAIFSNPGETGGGKETNLVDDDDNGYVDDYQGWDFYSDDNDPNPGTYANHGTACAGVAVATGDNSQGVAGVAYGSKVLPIKITAGSDPDAFASSLSIAYAIAYAASLADVLSCSWGSAGSSSYIMDAIDWATTNGRGGLGSPIFAATGNSASDYAGYTLSGFPAANWEYEWRYTKNASGSGGSDTAWLAYVRFPDGSVETFDSATTPTGWDMSPSGQTAWTIEDNPVYAYGAGRYQARAGSIGDSATTTIRSKQITNASAGNLAYKCWISSESGADGVSLYYRQVGGSWSSPFFSISGGNSPTYTASFPANYSGAIAVGASTNFDFRSDYSQYDTDGSASKELDFVAPSNGGSLAIYTTDRTGANSYNPSGKYTDTFGGTSSATPLAAGIAALMISEHPNLTVANIRTGMRENCDEIGGVTYDGSGWNPYYGYGRLNANGCVIYTLSRSVTTAKSPLSNRQTQLRWTNANEDGVARYELQAQDAKGEWQAIDSDVPGDGSYAAKVSDADGARYRLVVEMIDGSTDKIDF